MMRELVGRIRRGWPWRNRWIWSRAWLESVIITTFGFWVRCCPPSLFTTPSSSSSAGAGGGSVDGGLRSANIFASVATISRALTIAKISASLASLALEIPHLYL